jgi:hypothetical protein
MPEGTVSTSPLATPSHPGSLVQIHSPKHQVQRVHPQAPVPVFFDPRSCLNLTNDCAAVGVRFWLFPDMAARTRTPDHRLSSIIQAIFSAVQCPASLDSRC